MIDHTKIDNELELLIGEVYDDSQGHYSHQLSIGLPTFTASCVSWSSLVQC